MTEKHKCPVCGEFEFDEYCSLEICEVCGWQDDAVQEKSPDYIGGANSISLNQSIEVWKQTKDIDALRNAKNRNRENMAVFDADGKVILEQQ